MTNPESDLLSAIDALERDEIDDLVSWQLSRFHQRTGYDFNAAKPVCGHCGISWHGTPVGWCLGSHLSRQEALQGRETVPLGGHEPRWLREIAEEAASYGQHQIDAVTGIRDSPPGSTMHECTADLHGRCVWASCPSNRRDINFSVDLGAQPGAPWLPLEHASEDQSGSAYTINDLQELQNRWWSTRPYSYLEQFAPAPEQPRVRFWGNGPDGFMQVMEGELHIRDWSARTDGDTITYEITGSLRDPNEFMFSPEALLDSMEPDAEELPAPTEPLELDRISLEVQNRIAVENTVLEGFQAVGTIDQDAIQFETEREYDRISYLPGGPTRTIQTAMHHTVSMQLDAQYINEPLLRELIGREER